VRIYGQRGDPGFEWDGMDSFSDAPPDFQCGYGRGDFNAGFQYVQTIKTGEAKNEANEPLYLDTSIIHYHHINTHLIS